MNGDLARNGHALGAAQRSRVDEYGSTFRDLRPPPERWQARAACLGLVAEMFPDDDDDEGVGRAKAVCAGCDVRLTCLRAALASSEPPDGVWGGSTAEERDTLRRAARYRARRATR